MKRFFGGLLVAIGILLMTASGICSITVVVIGSALVINHPLVLLFPLVIGGLPFVTGGALLWVGSRVLKAANRP